MSTKTTNKELVNFSNNPRSENLINIIDKLLIERLPDLVNEEFKWLCEEYGDDEVSEIIKEPKKRINIKRRCKDFIELCNNFPSGKNN